MQFLQLPSTTCALFVFCLAKKLRHTNIHINLYVYIYIYTYTKESTSCLVRNMCSPHNSIYIYIYTYLHMYVCAYTYPCTRYGHLVSDM